MNCMDEKTIELFTSCLPTKHLRRSNENYVIIATPYLRAEFGKHCVYVQYTGVEKTSYSFDDFRHKRNEIFRQVRNAHHNHNQMATAIKERYVLMRSHLPMNSTFAMHGTDKERLTITIADSTTKDAIAQLHVCDCFCEVYINMLGPHIDQHTAMRVAFNKSGKR